MSISRIFGTFVNLMSTLRKCISFFNIIHPYNCVSQTIVDVLVQIELMNVISRKKSSKKKKTGELPKWRHFSCNRATNVRNHAKSSHGNFGPPNMKLMKIVWTTFWRNFLAILDLFDTYRISDSNEICWNTVWQK